MIMRKKYTCTQTRTSTPTGYLRDRYRIYDLVCVVFSLLKLHVARAFTSPYDRQATSTSYCSMMTPSTDEYKKVSE